MGRRTRRGSEPRRPRPRAKQHGGWRATLDGWGGLPVIGAITLATVVLAVLLLRQPLGFAQSDEPLMGEAVADAAAGHVDVGTLGPSNSQPPAGGPHYTSPVAPDASDQPIDDGYVVHSLEHGMIWLAYQPEMIDEDGLSTLRSLAAEYDRDVVLAPRPVNDAPLYAVSWGRRMVIDPDDEAQLRAFIETNRNRSPEPGIR